MAIKHWVGGDGWRSYSAHENWKDNDRPGPGDVAVLTGNSNESTSNILGGDYTSLGAHSLVVGPNWSGHFGGCGLPPSKFSLTALDYAGSGIAIIERDDDTTTTSVNVRMTAPADASGTCPDQTISLLLSGIAPITNFRVMGGSQIHFGTPYCTITTAEVIDAGRVEIDFSGCLVNSLKCNCGNITFGRCGNLEMSGDTVVRVKGDILTPSYAENVDMYGGTYRVETSGDTSSIKNGLRVFAGLFDASGCSSGDVIVNNAEVFGNGSIDERGAVADIVWANGVRIHGGTFLCSSGRVVTPT